MQAIEICEYVVRIDKYNEKCDTAVKFFVCALFKNIVNFLLLNIIHISNIYSLVAHLLAYYSLLITSHY